MKNNLLEVRELEKYFEVSGGLFSRNKSVVKAVDGISFDIPFGSSLGLVGQSGCGKTTTALDVVIQDQILNEIRKVQEVLGLSLIYISHDIAVIAEMTDNMAVMYAGRIVERGPTKEIFANPRHSYTKSLLESTPSVVGDKVKLKSLEGEPPSLINKESGCSFAPRCPYR